MPSCRDTVDDLIAIADTLSTMPGADDRRNVLRRRAISTSYYAAFRAIAYVFADSVVGWDSEADVLEPVFRSIDHKVAKNRLSASTDPDLRRVGTFLGRLQDKRIEADYATPAFDPTEAETANLIQLAREIVAILDGLAEPQRKLLAAVLISKAR